mgnify:CR=1 FL=1
MTKDAAKVKNKTIETIRTYQNVLSKEFWQVLPQLRRKLERLIETGRVENEYLCIVGFEKEMDTSYTVVTRDDAEELLDIIRRLDEKNAMDVFDEYFKMNDWPSFLDLREFEAMTKIHDSYKNAVRAEEFIID